MHSSVVWDSKLSLIHSLYNLGIWIDGLVAVILLWKKGVGQMTGYAHNAQRSNLKQDVYRNSTVNERG